MTKKKGYHVHIEANANPMSLNLREVWNYRDLIELYTKRNFTLTYKQTILGPAWIIINPLITSVVYTIVFGKMAGLSSGGVPKMLFYLCGNAFWGFFASCLSKNASAFATNAHIFKKAYFPRLTIPIADSLSSGIQLLIQMGLASIFILFYLLRGEVHPNWEFFPLLIPTVLVMGIMGASIGILISSITTKYRDLQFLVGFGLQLWMLASPVVYPLSQISNPRWGFLMQLNPTTAPMELFRYVILGTGSITWVSLLSTLLFVAVASPLSVLIFNRVERNFIDSV